MLKKVSFLIYIHLFMSMAFLNAESNSNDQFVETQGFAPLIDHQGAVDLDRVKKQLINTKVQDIVFDVAQSHSSDTTFQRKGVLIRRQNAVGTVLLCHGYLGCKRDAIALKHLFPTYNVMAFDFRAHGELTDGQKSTIGRDEALDVIGAVDFIKSDEQMSQKPVVVYGYSMGAVASIEAQAQDATLFDAMILDCPFDSTDNSMRRGMDAMKISVFGKKIDVPGKEYYLQHMYDENGIAQMVTNYLFKQITNLDSGKVATKFVKVSPVESVKKITTPCLFIHCDNDKKVPTQAVQDIYNNKPGFKELWITLGKGHFGSYNNHPELYWYKVNKFLSKVLSGDLDQVEQEKVYDHRNVELEDRNEQ